MPRHFQMFTRLFNRLWATQKANVELYVDVKNKLYSKSLVKSPMLY